MRFLHSLIIPYQELLGNYDFQIIDNALRCIISYQHNMRRIYHKFCYCQGFLTKLDNFHKGVNR